MKFRTILADPPWEYLSWSPKSNRAATHYPTQQTGWVERLAIDSIAERDCTLLMWATNPKFPDAFRVLDAWGFEFKTMLTWVKMSRAAAPRIGLGYHARACTEHLIVASRGHAPAPEVSNRPAGVIFCPIGEHSRKPEFQYDLAENYPGPYVELFHRPRGGLLFPPREGWTFLGNEVTGNDIAVDLRALAAQPSLFAEATP